MINKKLYSDHKIWFIKYKKVILWCYVLRTSPAWSKFLIFRNVSAGFINIYLIVRTIKLILDTVVHKCLTHAVYGWSVYLIGAFWNILNLLLYLGVKRKTASREEQEPLIHNQTITYSTTSETELKPLYPSLPPNNKEIIFSFKLPK